MLNNTILIAEEDTQLRASLQSALTRKGFDCIECSDVNEVMNVVKKQQVALLLADIGLQQSNSNTLLTIIEKYHKKIPMLMMAKYADVHQAIAAVHQGAKDYLVKPVDQTGLFEKINQYCQAKQSSATDPVAHDPKSKALLALAMRVANSDSTVLITGESGTGKEVLAKFIHCHSKRANAPFVAVNCAAIPENMLEAMLFGYEKGAFTGASQACTGKFEQAQGGTLLLDEISEMDLALQAKLLRVLQEQEVERLGGKKSIKLNVRVLATSNRDLIDAVNDNQFRKDLYYRINVFPLHWEPLSNRKKDIIPMAVQLIKEHCKRQQIKLPILTEDAEKSLLNYAWPGNVRELDNVIQRSLVLHEDHQITEKELYFDPVSVGQTSNRKKQSKTTIQKK